MRISSPLPGIRRAAAVALASAVVGVGLVACSADEDKQATADADVTARSQAAQEAADLGATWLEGELEDGMLVNEQYQTDDHSTTVDAAYALMEVGGHDDTVADMAAAVGEGADAYASPGKEVYAGALGKLVSLVSDTGGDPRDVAGDDLVAQLEARIDANGRISDRSRYGDYANSLGQAWAARGLTLADSDQAATVRAYLLQQQCADGYLRQDFSGTDRPCGPKDEPSVDTTALAVILLHDVAGEDPDLAAALHDATAWLVSQQAGDGSFERGGALGANANSTGLAGWALQVAGEEDPAANAAAWVRAHQVEGCEGGLVDEDGAIAYDDAALAAAARKGITAKTSYVWRLATAQALPALLAAPEGSVPAGCDAGRSR